MDDKRVGYFDILRIVSIFFVIVIHVTSVGLRLCETATPTWNVNWLLNSVSRWAVPVFFMVSGALFLEPSRGLTLKKLYKKNIFHIVVCIIVWGFFYSLLDQYIYGTLSAKSVLVAVYGIVTGNTGYHLWFLYTLVMLYIAVPLFRLITCHGSKRQLEYALVVWGVLSLLIGQINAFAAETGLGSDLLPYSPFVIAGYGGYFLLGYYLMLNPLKGKLKKACYILAVLSVCAIVGGKWSLFAICKVESSAFELPLGVFSCSIAVAVFTLAQSLCVSDNVSRMLTFLGQRVFGVYLTHVFFVSLLYHILKIRPDYCQPVVAIVMSSVGIFAVSFLASWILSKVPLLRKLV